MAESKITRQNPTRTEELTVTISAGQSSGEGTISGGHFLYNPNDYIWSASIRATSASNAYSNCFIQYLMTGSNSISVSVNRILRNDNSNAISLNIDLVGVHK